MKLSKLKAKARAAFRRAERRGTPSETITIRGTIFRREEVQAARERSAR